MPVFQNLVQNAQRLVPRGWAPVVRFAATLHPGLRRYPTRLQNGDRLVVDLRQTMCLGYFFHGRLAHEAGVERVINRSLGPGSVFVDVGANIGYYTRLASRLVGPSGRVYALEPQPGAMELLRLNVADLANVTALPLAAGREPGEVEFYIKKAGDTSSLDPSGAHQAVRVAMSTLDEVLRGSTRVDMVKIDVEGFEMEVLQGAVGVLQTHRPVVSFELVQEYARKRGLSLADFTAFFDRLDYRLMPLAGASAGPPEEASDILAVPAERAGSYAA